jgi:hypothetical protein
VTPTIDAAALAVAPVGPVATTIGVLERNRAVLQRATRVVRAAANLAWVAAEDQPAALRAKLAPATRLIACDAADAGAVLAWNLPTARLAAWSHQPHALLALAERDDRLVSLIGWPSFQSMPRSWELALATRMILSHHSDTTELRDAFAGTPAAAELRPRDHRDRQRVVAEVAALVERTGGSDRLAARISEVSHELIMNATYDAPIDARGEPRYHHDRRAPIAVRDAEVPTVQLATDGMLIAVRVTDRFGRLTRDQVLASLRRGADASHAAAGDVVDRSRGGAGLGLWRVYAGSAVTIVDIVPGYQTSVTAIFDVDLGARESRNLPPSLHVFDRGRLA